MELLQPFYKKKLKVEIDPTGRRIHLARNANLPIVFQMSSFFTSLLTFLIVVIVLGGGAALLYLAETSEFTPVSSNPTVRSAE